MLKTGVAAVRITPLTGSPLAGFAARAGVSTGTHDELYARALVLDTGVTAVAFISVDVLALAAQFVEHVRRAIAARIPLEAAGILIASTHTHAGPVTITTFFNPNTSLDSAYMERLAAAIEEAVVKAWENRVPSRVGVGTGRVEGLGVNRRTADHRPTDEEIGILRVDDPNGQPRAVLMNYACHPTVLGPDNLLASGDYPACSIERVETTLGAGCFAMFLNGAQGDVSVGHSSELSAIGIVTAGRTFELAARIGGLLGNEVLNALPSIQTRPEVRLGFGVLHVDLPLKLLPGPDEAERALRDAETRLQGLPSEVASSEYRHAKSQVLYGSITHFYAREAAGSPNGSVPIQLQGIRIDDTAFVAVPAEVFVEIGLRVKRAAPLQTFIAGIANGYIGYLPSESAYAAGGYEVVSAKVGPQSEERLIAGVMQLEENLI